MQCHGEIAGGEAADPGDIGKTASPVGEESPEQRAFARGKRAYAGSGHRVLTVDEFSRGVGHSHQRPDGNDDPDVDAKMCLTGRLATTSSSRRISESVRRHRRALSAMAPTTAALIEPDCQAVQTEGSFARAKRAAASVACTVPTGIFRARESSWIAASASSRPTRYPPSRDPRKRASPTKVSMWTTWAHSEAWMPCRRATRRSMSAESATTELAPIHIECMFASNARSPELQGFSVRVGGRCTPGSPATHR